MNNKVVLLRKLRAAVRNLRARVAKIEEERDHYYYRSLALERDVEFYRTPAREREYCPKCGKPRDQHCPDCGAIYPEG
jgi:hypothetical protein